MRNQILAIAAALVTIGSPTFATDDWSCGAEFEPGHAVQAACDVIMGSLPSDYSDLSVRQAQLETRFKGRVYTITRTQTIDIDLLTVSWMPDHDVDDPMVSVEFTDLDSDLTLDSVRMVGNPDEMSNFADVFDWSNVQGEFEQAILDAAAGISVTAMQR